MNSKSVVLFSTADWDNPFWTNKQFMALHLSQRGFKVLYIESMGLRKVAASGGDWSRILRRLGKFFSGAQKKNDNLWVFSPVLLPMHGSPLVAVFNKWFLKTQLRFWMRRLRLENSIAWTYNPVILDLVRSIGCSSIIYHCVDDLTAAPRLPAELIAREEERLLQAADAVFVTSQTLFDKLKPKVKKLIKYYPNVADYELFHQSRSARLELPKDLSQISGPRIGFIGAISGYKLDFKLLAEIARMRPEWNLVLIGKVGEGDPDTDASILKLPNIHLLGPRAHGALPSYLKGMDLVLLPCPLNDYTKAMFPMKFFEYLAAGKVIVATDLPALSPYRSAYLTASSSADFVRAIERVLSGEVQFTPEMDSLAREHTYEARLTRMLGDLGLHSGQ